jgi:hypothetical protein
MVAYIGIAIFSLLFVAGTVRACREKVRYDRENGND